MILNLASLAALRAAQTAMLSTLRRPVPPGSSCRPTAEVAAFASGGGGGGGAGGESTFTSSAVFVAYGGGGGGSST